MNFERIWPDFYVEPLCQELRSNPQLWNEHPERKDAPNSPHAAMSDIWLRFRKKSELIEPKHYGEPHIPEWYPSRRLLPSAEKICMNLMARNNGVQLGGVLITKIPPGGRIEPHNDKGRWHPEFFNGKFYVALQSNDKCLNKCENDVIIMKTGECWTFDNLKEHSVENNGSEDRITLIVCLRIEP